MNYYKLFGCVSVVSIGLSATIFAASLPAKDELKAVCGLVNVIGTPTDKDGVAVLFGFIMRGPKSYPEPIGFDPSIAVTRGNPNAVGFLSVLSSAYVTKNKVLVHYVGKEAYCVNTIEGRADGQDACPPSDYKPKCVGAP